MVITKNKVKYEVEKVKGVNTIVSINADALADGGDIVIPEKDKNGEPISAIDMHNSIDSDSLTHFNLYIADSIEAISSASFNDTRGVADNIYMGKNVKKVDIGAFYGTSAGTVYWPDDCAVVRRGVFSSAKIKRFVAGSSLRTIDTMAFWQGEIECLDFTNVIAGSKILTDDPNIWGVKEIIPPFYGNMNIDADGWEMQDDGIIRWSNPRASSIMAPIKPKGLEFVITGKLSHVRRDFEKAIASKGGFVRNTVTKTTDFLIVGDKPGKVKLDAAKLHRTPHITEYDLAL